MDKPIIAKYIRLSLDDKHSNSLSIENQRLQLDDYLLDSNLDGPVREFVDNGFSGVNFERPAVQELLELVRDGKVGCILVKDFSRFGRNAIETGYFIERVFPLYRVRFISVSDHFDSFEHDGDTGGMEVAFKFLMHEYYSKDLSRKISSSKREQARRGEAVSKNCAFGYVLDENRKLVIDPKAAETVRIIFDMYAGQKSIAAIEKRLYDEGRPTPAAWKKHRWKTASTEEFQCVWQKSVILSILRDEQYIGTYVAGKTRTKEVANPNRTRNDEADWIKIPNHHPAVVSPELFATVQVQLQKRGEPLRRREVGTAQRYADITSPLKGKVVCGHCGHTMRLSSTKNAAFHCWFTRSAPETACHRLRILSRELEDIVHKNIRQQANLVLEAVEDCPVDPRSMRQIECEADIDELRIEKQKLYERLVLDEIGRDEYVAQKTVLDAELDRKGHVLTAICDHHKKRPPNAASVEVARAALESNTLTKELAELMIHRVLIFPEDRIEIEWKVSGFENSASAKQSDFCVAN